MLRAERLARKRIIIYGLMALLVALVLGKAASLALAADEAAAPDAGAEGAETISTR